MCIRGKQDGIELDYNSLKSFQWLNELKEHDLVITGGEPTLHPNFLEIVNLLCKYAKTVTVTTNGTVSSYIKDLYLHENLRFQISIDGNLETHNSIRGEGTYEKSFDTIDQFAKIGVNISVASVANKNNANSMIYLEKKLRNCSNLNYWRISYEMPFGSAGFDNMMSTTEWNYFVDNMLAQAQVRMKIQKIFPFELYDSHKEDLDKMIGKHKRINNCGSGQDKIYIYPDLQVYSCTCLTDFPLGNLNENMISNLLSGVKISNFSNYEVNNKICLDCEYFKYCNGGCIGMSYHYFGKIGMGDIRCPKLQAQEVK